MQFSQGADGIKIYGQESSQIPLNPNYYRPFGATSDIGGAQCTPLLVMHVPLVLS